MKKLLCLLLLPLLLLPVFAEDGEIPTEAPVETLENGYSLNIPDDWTLQELLGYYIETYRLNTDCFAISIYLPVTGERYDYNETALLFAASTYKLPLNMYYYEREAEGVYSHDMLVGGVPLSTAHFQSIVYSNNEVSHAMIYGLGSFYDYKYLLLQSYGGMSVNEIGADFWADNYYCTKFMCNTLQYLYEHSDTFTELIGYMKQAMPGQYMQSYAGDTEVAHKYGVFYTPQVSHNDVGILYTDEPVLVAIYTYGFSGSGIDGAELTGRIAKGLICYQEKNAILAEIAAEEEARRESESIAAEEEARRESESIAAEEEARRESESVAAEESRALEESVRRASEEEAAGIAASEAAEQAERETKQHRTVLLISAIAAGAIVLAIAAVLLKARAKRKVGSGKIV